MVPFGICEVAGVDSRYHKITLENSRGCRAPSIWLETAAVLPGLCLEVRQSVNKYDLKMQQILEKHARNCPVQQLTTVTDTELDALEHELGHSLPSDYREFLKDYGDLTIGAAVDFSQNESGPAYCGCEYLCGINCHNPSNNLLNRYQNRGDGWPSELLPIGVSDNGLMCLVIDGPEKGYVYFWHWGQGGGDPTPEHIHFVASSFDEFVKRLEY